LALPKYDQLMLPLMKLLKVQIEPIRIADAAKMLAIQSGLSEEELSQTLPSGKYIFADRVSWAKTYLVKAGLVHQPKRAFCELSQRGKELDLSSLSQITNEYLMQFEGFSKFKLGVNDKNNDELGSADIPIDSRTNDQTPLELIEGKAQLLENEIKEELITLIKNNPPAFFERLVVDLLVAMGYGGSHHDAAQAIGKTNDGGIDGIISEDRLGLDKIYIQAKRWESTVGRPDIQQFKGALADQVAKKGVFITTSNFSKEAIESAKKSGVVLIDGDKLTSLMIEFGLGVTIERSFHVYRIDSDRFEENIY
jgi:restriction system protein